MRDIVRRITTLETQQRLGSAIEHFISVLRYPWRLSDEAREAWLREQLRCDCRVDCAGKSVGLLVPEQCSEEEWDELAPVIQQRHAFPGEAETIIMARSFLNTRLSRLEAQYEHGGQPARQILIYPAGMNEAALTAWIHQARTQSPDAPMLIFLPEKGSLH